MRRLILILSGISLLTCLALVRLSIRSDAWHGHLTVRHETAEGDAHTRRWWQLDFGTAVTFTSTWYYENHLLPTQIEVLKEEIARWPRVQWEEWPRGRYQLWNTEREIGPFREESSSGSIDSGFCVRYGTLIALFAALPGLLFLRGTTRAITQIRSRRGALGPPRPAGRKVTIAAAASFVPLLFISLAWLESEVSGIAANRIWVITTSDDGTHCGNLHVVSLRGRLHVTYAKGGPDLRYPNPSTDDLLPPLWEGSNYFRWHAVEDVPELGPTQTSNTLTFLPTAPEQWHGWSDFRLGSVIDKERCWIEAIASYWIPWALCVPVPLYWLARRRGWIGRRAAGLCAGCGYDLRATSTRCPECGRPIVGDDNRVPTEVGMKAGAPTVPS